MTNKETFKFIIHIIKYMAYRNIYNDYIKKTNLKMIQCILFVLYITTEKREKQ